MRHEKTFCICENKGADQLCGYRAADQRYTVQPGLLFWFGLMLNVPVNNFSVMLGRSHRFLGITRTIWGVILSC